MNTTRLVIKETSEETIIEIPSKKYYWMAGFSFTWLVIWLISVLVLSIILYAVIKSDQSYPG